MDELVSVVVPIYGVANYLKQCIESIINQTYRNLEIILVDDGSDDGSAQICDEYARKDDRIIVIHKENGGLVSARKAGVEICRGSCTAYVDGDDWIEPDYIEEMKRLQIKYSVDLIVCNCVREGKEKVVEKTYFDEGFYDRDQLENLIFCKMIFTGKFDEFGISPNIYKLYNTNMLKYYQKKVPDTLTLGEDAALFYPMLLNCSSIYIINKPMYHYRFNNDSITLKYNERTAIDSIELNSYLRETLPNEYSLHNQLDYYQSLIGLINVVNVARGGIHEIDNHLAVLEEYFSKSKMQIIINKCSFKNANFSQRVGLILMKHGLYKVAVRIYIIKLYLWK